MAVRPDTTTKSSTPAPAKTDEDLEQYGVWVKAEPQDILEEPEILSLGSVDFDLPSEEPLPGADSFLTDDEEKLLGSFDSLDSTTEASIEAEEALSSPKGYSDISDIENLPPLQDFEIGDAAGGEIEDFGASTIDISLDELETSVDQSSPISPHAKLDPHKLSGLDSPSDPVAKESWSMDTESAMEDVSAEFLDLEDGDNSARNASDVTSEFLDTEEGTAGISIPAASEPDFEPIDMDLHFDDSAQAAAAGGEPGFEAVSEFDDFLAEEAPASLKTPFDDLSAVEEDLAAPREPSPRPRSAQPAEPSLSNDLLQKIAEELSSIRGELVTLKGQLGALKPEDQAKVASTEDAEGGIHVGGGFFDDEEDETIALTGDELDNILNTADFTEENAEGDSPAPPQASEDLLMEALLPENGDYRSEEPAIEEIRLEPASEPNPAIPEEDVLDGFGLDEGVQHLTQAPEDTSYLEEPLPGEEPLDLSEIPLHEESLADSGSYPLEPEGEDFAPLEEISEELPVVEGSSGFDADAETLADMTLSMDAAADYMTETPSEVESLAPLPELEDIGFGELSLAEESPEPATEEVAEELEELVMEEEDLSPMDSYESGDLEAKIAEKTVKPATPVSFHPDEIPTSLDDSFFVGGPRPEPEEETLDLDVEEFDMPSTGVAIKAEPEVQPPAQPSPAKAEAKGDDTERLKSEIKGVLSYLDKLLESLPESKIEEFARSEHFETYKRLFDELGLLA